MEKGVYLTVDVYFVSDSFTICEAYHSCTEDTRIACPQPNKGDIYRVTSPVFMYEDNSATEEQKARQLAKEFCSVALNKFFANIELTARAWKKRYKPRKKWLRKMSLIMQDGHLVEE